MHSDADGIGRLFLRSDDQFPRPVRHRPHGFHAVQHQIQEHLLQLDAIGQHRWEVGRQVGFQRYPIAAHLAFGQGDDLPDNVVDRKPHFLWLGFPHERANPRDHLARSVPIPDHAPHRFPCLIEVRRIAGEPAQAGIAVRDDGGERLIDFMGDGGRQLPHGHHPREMRQFRLRLVQRLLRPLARGDVVVKLQGGDGPALFVSLQCPPALHHDSLPVTAGVDQLALPAPAAEQFGKDVFQCLWKDRLQEVMRDFPSASSFVQPYIASAPRFQ